MTAPRSIVIHGHFYQPPREDPWFGEVEAEPNAAPFHDWNERIDRECYRAVAAARIPGGGGRIARIMNTLTGISFNIGSTLLTWMEREALDSYQAFIAADRESRTRRASGNAMAMPYHHVILPLCSRRDKVTEVRWGLRDFRQRFGREAEGMWLPEAAVDDETLDVLAAEGIRFTVVGPSQVRKAPAEGMPGRVRTSGGRSIAVFVYDGQLSHDVAFGPLLQDANRWVARLLETDSEPRRLVSLATDGETWGHHHKFGEMALAAVLDQLARTEGVLVENFASFLARHPPTEDVVVVSPSSWSCPHGVERWRTDCGCKMAPHVESQQQWRVPLRVGLDWLATELHDQFAREAKEAFADVWVARDERGGVAEESFGSARRSVRARELLELERNVLAMFTSCGWFFDDVGDIATLVVLRHAARAIELAGDPSKRLETGLLRYLSEARSNDPAIGDGAQLYQKLIGGRPTPATLAAAGFAAAYSADPRRNLDLPGYRFSFNGTSVVVEDRRTGRREFVDASIVRSSVARMVVTVQGHSIDWADLPEGHRTTVTRAMIRDTVEKSFSPDDLESLRMGETDLKGLAERGLVTAAESAAENGVERLTDLLDLFALLGIESVPFDAQTTFYRTWSLASGELLIRLNALAPRMGFATP